MTESPGDAESEAETTATMPAVTAPMQGGQTQSEHSQDTRPRRSGVSVRTRLTVTMAVMTSFALLVAGVVIYTVESARRDVATIDAANQEVAELRQFLESGVDPATGARFTEPEPLLRAFLERNVAGPDEVLVAWVDGGVRLLSDSPQTDVVESPAVAAQLATAVKSLIVDGGATRLDTTDHGEVLVTVQPVANDEREAALVVVSFFEEQRQALGSLLRTYLVVAVLAMLLVTGLAAWQGRRLLAPLGALAEAAHEISETDLTRRVPESGNDDITALTRTVNDMLERLETAFEGQRQFLDDAGHELRTPLTVLGGHLELLDASDPVEVASTRELLLDEVERMGRLVDDLILLAKSRRPDFLSPAAVDLDVLSATVLAKARGMAQRQWHLDDVAAVRVIADEQRITQALLQLVDNAVKHTDPEDTIAVGSSVTGSTARVWVRDTGPGIAPQARESVLERFARAEVRADDEGFGLGLSIVAAIATAHGGRVVIEETEGGGATVIIEFGVEESSWPAS